jgi:dipeptidase
MCDTLVVVRPEAIFFAKNSDRDPNEAQLVEHHPRRASAPGSLLRCTHRSIPEVARTHATLLCRPFWMWGAEMGANEYGVVIGNEAVFTRQRLEPDALTGMDLLRLALERASSADEAVQVITTLLERHGQGGSAGYEDPAFEYSSSFLVADGRSAWVLETAGRRWATERVAQGARSISNGLTIPAFARDHADPLRTRFSRCRERAARTRALAHGARHLADVASVLRDHGEGHRWPRYRVLDGGLGAPCMHAGGLVIASQTVGSMISELRAGATRHFVTGTSAPCVSVFRPVDAPSPAISAPGTLGGAPRSTDDRDTLWWRFERLHRLLMKDPAHLAEPHLAERARLERSFFDGVATGAEAHAQAEAWMVRVEASLVGIDPVDQRPPWVRRYWSERDRQSRA